MILGNFIIIPDNWGYLGNTLLTMSSLLQNGFNFSKVALVVVLGWPACLNIYIIHMCILDFCTAKFKWHWANNIELIMFRQNCMHLFWSTVFPILNYNQIELLYTHSKNPHWHYISNFISCEVVSGKRPSINFQIPYS